MLTFNINTTKNLLAFSGGIDSTALFFMLLEKNIPFDIAIVDYNIRAQSKDEVAYAQTLAKKYGKQCFIKDVTLQSKSNFEKEARTIRYAFFESLIKEHHYESLMTAHQLDDQLEWFLMQFSKGAGLIELLGFQEEEKRAFYTLYRPLLQITKEALLGYLKQHEITYFVDESNEDTKYHRNYVRKHFSQAFINQYAKGIKKSFDYLQQDLKSMHIQEEIIYHKHGFQLLKACNDDNINIRLIDINLKKRGLLLSKAQRDEILLHKALVVSHQFAVNITQNYIWIAPYTKVTMSKMFKEKCRVLKIPKNVRGYLFSIELDLDELTV